MMTVIDFKELIVPHLFQIISGNCPFEVRMIYVRHALGGADCIDVALDRVKNTLPTLWFDLAHDV